MPLCRPLAPLSVHLTSKQTAYNQFSWGGWDWRSQISIIMEGNASTRQTRDKVELTISSIGEIRFENKFDVSHMSYQKPRLRPRLTAFLTQSLSRGPCKAVATAQAGSAFLGSASAGLRLRAEPCTSLSSSSDSALLSNRNADQNVICNPITTMLLSAALI